MDLLTKVNEKIEENKAEMITSLSALLRIPSVAGGPEGPYPFGKSVQQAYESVLELAAASGFTTWNGDNYGGHIEYTAAEGGDPEIVGILGHLDVVPEGSGWDCEPFGGDVKDGYIWGRGAIDDKGPTIAVLYAMKALKECGFAPRRSVRLILGLDEETNWSGMDYYLDHVDRLPAYGFTPDGDFPAIHGEMGILIFDLARKFAPSTGTGLELTSITGGTVPNAVADTASAVLYDKTGAGYEAVKEQVSAFRAEKSCQINGRGVGKSFKVTVKGVAAHGAHPERGLNAISLLMDFLGNLHFANEDMNDFIAFYNDCIGFDLHGERIGCNLSDAPSGKLIFNVGMIELDKRSAQLTINIRYPVTSDCDTVYSSMMPILDRYNIGIVKSRDQLPIYMDRHAPLIETLMELYQKHTGDLESEPAVIGGGTYARAIDNAVAFGPHLPGRPQLEHQANENIAIDDLMLLTRLYAETIYKLTEL